MKGFAKRLSSSLAALRLLKEDVDELAQLCSGCAQVDFFTCFFAFVRKFRLEIHKTKTNLVYVRDIKK